ncbi:hypothetical protein [Pseudomonas shirazensis]
MRVLRGGEVTGSAMLRKHPLLLKQAAPGEHARMARQPRQH